MLPLLCLFFLLWSALNEICYGQKTIWLKNLLPKAEIYSKILVIMTYSAVHSLIAKLLAIILMLYIIQSRCERRWVWSYGNVFILISWRHGINIIKLAVVVYYYILVVCTSMWFLQILSREIRVFKNQACLCSSSCISSKRKLL